MKASSSRKIAGHAFQECASNDVSFLPSFFPFFSSHPDCCEERSLWQRRPAFLSSGKSKETFFLFPTGIAARISSPFLKESREIERDRKIEVFSGSKVKHYVV